MELQAYSLTYTHPGGGQGTAILYASCGEAAEVAFYLSFHPSKELVKVEPMARRRFQAHPLGGLSIFNKGVQKST